MLEATKSMLHHIMHDVREPRKTVTRPETNNKATVSFDPRVENPKIICNSGLHGKLFTFSMRRPKRLNYYISEDISPHLVYILDLKT
jgi:hypothetical protein